MKGFIWLRTNVGTNGSPQPPSRICVNRDCGLKTRGWAEVEPALRYMVDAARALREQAA